jgi:branched-chain amino acid transport system permease protein
MNVAQQLVNGLVLGSGYACVALGWTVLLGAAKLVNFAHGQMYMLGAFICWFVMTRMGVSYPVGITASVLALGLLGVLMQWAMLRLVMVQNLTSMMIVTLGFGYVIQGGSGLAFGGAPHNFPSGLDLAEIKIGDIWFTWQDVLILGVTLVLYGSVWMLLRWSRIGAIIRAVAEDPKLAQLFGISPAATYIGIFVFESVMVALAAVLVAPRTPILTSMGFDEVIITFVIVVLGGVGSVPGALVAGLGLGMFTAFFGALVSPAYTTAAAFGVLLVVLVARRDGLAA